MILRALAIIIDHTFTCVVVLLLIVNLNLQLKMSAVVEEINDKHMGPWAELCETDHTENTPLTPYMDEELLYYKHLSLSNEKLKELGYSLRVPYVTRDKLEEVSCRQIS